MFEFRHCACTPQDRQIIFQLIGALIAVLLVVMVWVNWRGWQSRQRFLAGIKDAHFGYEGIQKVYRVWDKRTGKTVLEAKSEAEAIGWIKRMSSLETSS